MLAKDRAEPDDRLDFFEARFDLAIKRLRLSTPRAGVARSEPRQFPGRRGGRRRRAAGAGRRHD
ncbi:hypothetical protein AB5I41_09790 [Sphingomonas sp. MMS24-JH45]